MQNSCESGGIYKNVKISVKTLDIIIIIGLLALTFMLVFLSLNGGFLVSFDTLGGSEIAPQKIKYGQNAALPLPPVKNGYVFAGWYCDKQAKTPFDFDKTAITDKITLYAKWIDS